MNKSIVIIALMAFMALVVSAADKDTLVTYFEISPNPMNRYTQIEVGLERPAEIQIVIQDLQGNICKHLFGGMVDKDVSVYWNRQANDGSIVPAGEYEVVVSFGTRYTSVKKTLILR